MKFLINHRRAFQVLSLTSALFAVTIVLCACGAPQWIQDAQTLIPVLAASITSVISFIAGMSGNTALAELLSKVSVIINNVGNSLNVLEKLIEQYKDNPSDSIIAQVNQVAELIKSNLNEILTASGLPASVQGTIAQWANLVLGQLEAWLAVLPAIHMATQAKSLHALNALKPADDRVMDAKALKAAFNQIWETKTGDADVDAALAKVIRLA